MTVKCILTTIIKMMGNDPDEGFLIYEADGFADLAITKNGSKTVKKVKTYETVGLMSSAEAISRFGDRQAKLKFAEVGFKNGRPLSREEEMQNEFTYEADYERPCICICVD